MSYDLHILPSSLGIDLTELCNRICDEIERDEQTLEFDQERIDQLMLEQFPFYELPGWGKALDAVAYANGNMTSIELTYNESAGPAPSVIDRILLAATSLGTLLRGEVFDAQLDRPVSTKDRDDMIAAYEKGRRVVAEHIRSQSKGSTSNDLS